MDAALLWMALDNVYHSGFTSTAVGNSLDLLGADLGLARSNLQASGTATFSLAPSAPAGALLRLPIGTLIDTGPDNPISFQLTATVTLTNDPTQPAAATADKHDGHRGIAGRGGQHRRRSTREDQSNLRVALLEFRSELRAREEHRPLHRRGSVDQ